MKTKTKVLLLAAIAMTAAGITSYAQNAQDQTAPTPPTGGPHAPPPLFGQVLQSILEKYDANKDGRLEVAEQKAISDGDRARLKQAGLGGAWWASVLYTVVPNWQLFWLADVLETGKTTFHWGYVGKAFAYVVGYVGAALSVAVLLFEERELS